MFQLILPRHNYQIKTSETVFQISYLDKKAETFPWVVKWFK